MSDIQSIANAILFFFWLVFFNSVLERRFSLWITFTGWAAACSIWLCTFLLLPRILPLKLLPGLVVYLLAVFVLFHSRWTRILFYSGMALVIMAISELIMLLIFPGLGQLKSGVAELPRPALIGMYLVYLPLNALLLRIGSLLFGRYKNRLPSNEGLLYALFPASQFVIIASWFMLLLDGPSVRVTAMQAAAVLLCAAADVALYFAVRGMAQRAELRAENALLEKQIDGQKEHYMALTAQYENIRHMRHDIDNHLHTIQILLQNGQNSAAATYAAELRPDGSYQPHLGQCENPVVDAFLFNRVSELRTQGIAVDEQIALPADIGISNVSLISAFGNLIDNASEACGQTEDKHIGIKALIRSGYLVIETENLLPETDSKKRRIPELPRGVGFHILDELAEKYEGEFIYGASGDVFQASLTLKVVMRNAEHSNLRR